MNYTQDMQNAIRWISNSVKNGEIVAIPEDRMCFLRSELRAILREKGYSLSDRNEIVNAINYDELSNYILNNLGI
jgi:hypothetical protein